jgi:hypothetical protein
MAYSLQQAMDAYFDNSGGNGGKGAWYGGTGFSGGYGTIAGGSTSTNGGKKAPSPKAQEPTPPKTPAKLPFNPGDYAHQERLDQPGFNGWQFYNGKKLVPDSHGRNWEVPCDGWQVSDGGEVIAFAACPPKKPLVSSIEWDFYP